MSGAQFPLSSAFVAASPEAAREAGTELERELLEIVEAAALAWPGVKLLPERFVRHLAERSRKDQAPAALSTAELYLACACLERDRAALLAFDAQYLSQVEKMVAHLKISSAGVEELTQALRTELLLAEPGRAAKLASYQGQGALLGWLRVTAVRAGLKLLPRRTETGDEELEQVASHTQNPELELAKAANQVAFREAFREAFQSLPPEEQNLLRQHYLDDLSIDRLGALHKMHRTSCARWLRQAREKLLRRTEKALLKRGSRSECENMIRDAQSRFEITMRSLLR